MELSKCPCCGAEMDEPLEDYEICPVCKWENDPVQLEDPSFAGGANELSLLEARKKWEDKAV